MAKTVIEGSNVSKFFGGLAAVKNIDFDVKEKEIIGLIGPNGAGKTTLFNVIAGVYRPTSGSIKFCGEDITRLKIHDICRRGIGRTFQIDKPFLNLTVLDSATVAAFAGGKSKSMEEARKKALDAIEFIGMSKKKDVLTKDLTVSHRKLTELARALATGPKLLLLDEVIAGLNPSEVKDMLGVVKQIRERGITVMWVEHVMQAVMSTSDRIIVMNHGEKLAEGTPEEMRRNKQVIEAYLGEAYLDA